jgi:hypothetical protein
VTSTPIIDAAVEEHEIGVARPWKMRIEAVEWRKSKRRRNKKGDEI